MKSEKELQVGFMKRMMNSLFAYHSLSKDNEYLAKYVERLGKEKFNKVYDEYSETLKNEFTIKTNVYSDHEGCTYNSLVKK